jgi:UbiD family decarboxylase
MTMSPVQRSLRDYVSALESLGDIQVIKSAVDVELELGAVIRRSYELRAPAPLFTNVRGAAPGSRVLGAPGALSSVDGMPLARVALSLGLPAESGAARLVEALAAIPESEPLPPRRIAEGVCQEHVHLGPAADLARLPAPLIHSGDGGRYLNTWGIIVARTPDGSWTNWSITRAMVLDAHRLAVPCPPYRHLGQIHAMWRERGQDMPVAIAMGTDPVIPFASAMRIPAFVDEAAKIGGYLGEPLDVVSCVSVPLEVPATAEIVVEGNLSISETAMEGPVGEYTGYLPAERLPRLEPVLRVSAITHRTDPVLPVVCSGVPVDENHTAGGCAASAALLGELREAGLPVSFCWMPFEAGLHLAAVSVGRGWRAHATGEQLCRKIGEVVFSSPAGISTPRLVVVEDDVDLTDTSELLWAWTTRSHPVRDVITLADQPMARLPIFLSPEERQVGRIGKVVVNALGGDDWTPADRPVRMSFGAGWPPLIRQRVLSRWTEYGFGTP